MKLILTTIPLITCFSLVNGECQDPTVATTGSGIPLRDRFAIRTVGCRGPVPMEAAEFLDDQSHIDRERIPERIVHAKGFGAKGFFEVTNDITKYSAAKVFSSIGKKTRVTVRFSNGFADKGGADTQTDIRGYSIKFYTEEGIWDLVALNLRVFVINDPKLFSSLAHASKRHPTTNLMNATTFWDFLTLRPESTHGLMWLFSQTGFPCSMRNLNAFGINTFRER
ncbi:catalase-like isoform X3 [Agrilus planipennis]|uniref:Catalase-like isoform X3 n=1 Tax=Agrilus planipennis TaxID=224129 RepID=A0A7F5RB08_AGRPL|nr:catalase-like isoform X3 [Agrilus planipennis]